MKNFIRLIYAIGLTLMVGCGAEPQPSDERPFDFSLESEMSKEWIYIQLDTVVMGSKQVPDAYGDPIEKGRWYVVSTKTHNIFPAMPMPIPLLEVRRVAKTTLGTSYTDGSVIQVEVSLLGDKELNPQIRSLEPY